MGMAEFISSSTNVFIEGMPAVRQGDLMVSNNKNTPPMPLVQPGAGMPSSKAKEGAGDKSGEDAPEEVAWGSAGAGSKGNVLKSDEEEGENG